MKIKWSKELVIQSILNRLTEGKAVNYQAVVKDDEKLTGAARRYFGSWDNAMKAAGFEQSDYKFPETEKEEWSREKIIDRLRTHIENGRDISPSSVQKYDSKLYASACKYFGSWGNLVEHLGIEYDDIKKTKEWNEEIIIETIQKAYSSGADLSHNTVAALSSPLYGAAMHHFKGWREALEAAGINPSSVRRTKEWDKDKVIDIVTKAFECGVTLKQLESLGVLSFGSVYRFFSSSDELYAAAGITPDEYKVGNGSPVKNNIRYFREKQGLSQTKLGEKVGYSHRWVSLVENHTVGVRMDDAIKLAKALNKNLDELFPIE